MSSPEILYKKAYDLQYKRKASAEALVIYHAIVERFPGSQEASYAQTQIGNLGSLPLDKAAKEALDMKLNSEGIVNRLNSQLADEQEKHLLATCDQWEYKILVDAGVENLNALGLLGWELVSSAAYQTGGGTTFNGSGGERYIVHIHHSFKRRIPRMQSVEMMRISEQLSQIGISEPN